MHKETTFAKNELNSSGQIRLMRFAQVVIWPVVLLLGVILCKKAVTELDKSDITPGVRYVIAATHNNAIDPFVIMRHLTYGVYTQLIPVRFFAYNKLLDKPYGRLLRALGSFPASDHPRFTSGLDAALLYMESGQTVQIFPEGKRNRGNLVPARSGVAVLANQKNTQVILANIVWERQSFIPKYSICISRPQTCNNMTAQDILNKIRALSV